MLKSSQPIGDDPNLWMASSLTYNFVRYSCNDVNDVQWCWTFHPQREFWDSGHGPKSLSTCWPVSHQLLHKRQQGLISACCAPGGRKHYGRHNGSRKIGICSFSWFHFHMEVCINGGTQQLIVYKGKSQSKMDDLEVPLFQETSIHGDGSMPIVWKYNMFNHSTTYLGGINIQPYQLCWWSPKERNFWSAVTSVWVALSLLWPGRKQPPRSVQIRCALITEIPGVTSIHSSMSVGLWVWYGSQSWILQP